MEQWLEEYLVEKPSPDTGLDFLEAMEWLKSRPQKIKELILQFPPSCVVKGKIDLCCPAPGKHAVVVGYCENDSSTLVKVFDPEGRIEAECRPEWLEVTHFSKGLTPEKMKMMIWGGAV